MLFEADEYLMTVGRKQQITDLGNFHHEFQFLEVHRICLTHYDDDDVDDEYDDDDDDDDDSAEDITNIHKCSGFLEGIYYLFVGRGPLKTLVARFISWIPIGHLFREYKKFKQRMSTFCPWNVICYDNNIYLELSVAKIPCFHKSTSYICPEVHGQAISMVMVKCARCGHLEDCFMDLRHTRVFQNTLKTAHFLFSHVL